MSSLSAPKISYHTIQAIRDAILLGGAREIDDVLSLIEDDEDFPETLRYGLEAMLYYRRYYGKGGELEPPDGEDKKRAVELEIYWGRELIESLQYYAETAKEKFA
jgi:hypothetical protein